jgi:F-box/leucine-rich repeat protein 2/20
MPWRNDVRSQTTNTLPPLSLEPKLNERSWPVYRRSLTAAYLKGSRSYSSPFPISALDIIPSVPTNVFIPIPIVPRNFFDELLPRELRLKVLSSLVALREAEQERSVREGQWTVLRASSLKNRWVGKDKGIRELVKLSRASNTSSEYMNKILM